MKTVAFLLMSVLILVGNIPVTQQQQQCLAILDLVFTMDGSNSMGATNFQRQKDSLINLVRTLSIGENEVRIGLVLFSSIVSAAINLTGDKNGFIAAINALKYPDEETRTDLGIEAARTMFSQYGRTSGVPDVMIIITDGKSTKPDLTHAAVTAAKNQGITVFAIGVTDLTDRDELNMIASSLDKVFITEDFVTLEASLNNATNRACVDLQTTAVSMVTAPPPVPACFMGQTDVWLVVDVSRTSESLSRVQSVGDFQNLKRGLSKTIEIIQDPSVANPGVRLGVILFSDVARVVSDVSWANSVGSAASAVQQIPGGVSQGGASLVPALQNIVTPPVKSSYRSYVALVAPESTFVVNTAALGVELARLKALGYTIVVFVVRENGALDQLGLQTLASGSRFFYYIPGYLDLEAAAKNFTRDRLCNGLLGNSTGLCAESGYREKGVGVVAHPTDCDKYIQCYYDESENLDLGVVRQCPMGLHWSAVNETCSNPRDVKCANDKCKEDCSPYKMEGSCGAFWECVEGVSTMNCCQQNYTFVAELGCQLDYSCTDSCGPEKWCGKCQKKPNWEKLSGYDVTILGGNVWMPRPCFYKDFDILHCGCTASRNEACPADSTFDFANAQTMRDIDEGRKPGIRVSDVQKSAEGIALGPKSAVHVDVDMVETENQTFTLEFRFRELEKFSPYGETLFSSGLHCSAHHSVLVSANDQFVFVEVRSAKGIVAEVKVPTKGLNKDEFKDLVLLYSHRVLALSISDKQTQYIAKTTGHTNIFISCGLDVGQGLNKLSFAGTVQKISVYSCAWPLLY